MLLSKLETLIERKQLIDIQTLPQVPAQREFQHWSCGGVGGCGEEIGLEMRNKEKPCAVALKYIHRFFDILLSKKWSLVHLPLHVCWA